MMIFRRIICGVLFLVILAYTHAGCMRFTERDYELQKNAYEKQRQQEEAQKENQLNIRW